MAQRNATIDDVGRIVTPWRGVEEAVLNVDGDVGRVGLPVAVAADRDEAARIVELRVCFSSWPLTGGHAIRPPLLQQDPDAQVAGVVGRYQRALATGDAAAAVAAFEPDAYVREPAGGTYVHRGHDQLRALYERFFSNGGGIPAGALCGDRRRPRVRARIQRSFLGPHRAAARGRPRRVRARQHRETRRRPHLRRLRAAGQGLRPE